jgi:hypothetical protein
MWLLVQSVLTFSFGYFWCWYFRLRPLVKLISQASEEIQIALDEEREISAQAFVEIMQQLDSLKQQVESFETQ